MAARIVPIMSTSEDVAPSPTSQRTEQRRFQIDKMSLEQPTAGPERVPFASSAVRITVPLGTTSRALYSERKLVRRDSLDRREAILKGKEGSRQRRRWENDRLISNPWAVPPSATDWEICPTYPRRTVPYYLAPLWDAAEFQRAIESKLKGRRSSTRNHGKRVHNSGMSPMEEKAASIPKEVRARLKHAKSAKGLLQDLEETVRTFVHKWNEKEIQLKQDGLHDVPLTSDSEEDEEIVFVGRTGAMHESSGKTKENREGLNDDETISTEKMVFEGLDTDKGAAFARWLVHCLGSYYSLRTWSVTHDVEGEDKRRQAFVGVDSRARGFLGRGVEVGREIELPRPLWGMV